MIALLAGVCGAWASTDVTINPSNGVYWKNGAVTSDAWAPIWKSTATATDGTTPLLVLTAPTGMRTADGAIWANATPYSLEAASGYVITGYTINGTARNADITIIPAGESGTTVTQNSSLGSPLAVTPNSRTTSFTLSAASGYLEDVEFIVTVAEAAFDPGDLNGKTFKMQCKRGYVYWNGSTMVGHASNATKFAIVTYNAETYLYDATNSAFVCHTTLGWSSTNGNPALESNNDFSKAVKNISFGSTGIATYPYYMAETVYNTWLNMDGTPKVYFNKWQNFEGGNGGNTYKVVIEDIDFDDTDAVAMLDNYFNPSATVTYRISDASGVIFTSNENPATVGDNITALPSEYQRSYCSYSAINHTVVAGSNIIDVTVTSYTPPFTVSTDYANATWYYMNGHASYNNRFISTNDDALVWAAGNGHTDAYKWAFIGNAYQGIKIVNKAAGSTKYLQETDPVTMSTTEKGWRINQQTNTSWYSGANGFGIWSDSKTKYVNTQGSTLKYWGSFDQGSTYWVTEVPAYEVTVTYDLYVGGDKVNTVVVEYVPGGSAVNIPASLTANYSSLAYNYSTSTDVIANEDCTIDVTATLKSGVKLPAELSNTKTYRLTTLDRGSLSTYDEGEGGSFLASPVKTALGISGKEFAIIEFESKYYLYSVSDSKFVTYQASEIAPLADMVTGTSDAIAFSQTTNSVYQIRFDNSDSKILNSSGSYTYGITINGWGDVSGEWDTGNQYIIEEVGDFDATDALAALDEAINGPTAFAAAIAELKAINWGLTSEGNKGKPNYYNFIGDYEGYAGNEMNSINGLEAAGYSKVNLSVAQDILANGYALNIPATGKFYRIKGYSNNFITSNTASSNAAMNGTETANNIIYYSDSRNLIFFGSGYGLYNTSIVAPAGSSLNAYTFKAGAQSSHYYIQSNAAGVGTYCYDNTANGTKLDRNGSPVTSGSYQTDWTVEEITTLPITITAAGYATLYSPVALTIPSGVTAYIASNEGSYLHLTAIDGGIIPANTGVILAGEANTYNFEITTGGSAAGNVLTGTVVTIAKPDGTYYLSNGSKGVGFYMAGDGVTTLAGFRAYLPAGLGVKGFLGFEFDDADGIKTIDNGKLTIDNAEIYNLAGQRVNKLQRGVNIVNGKKVIVK